MGFFQASPVSVPGSAREEAPAATDYQSLLYCHAGSLSIQLLITMAATEGFHSEPTSAQSGCAAAISDKGITRIYDEVIAPYTRELLLAKNPGLRKQALAILRAFVHKGIITVETCAKAVPPQRPPWWATDHKVGNDRFAGFKGTRFYTKARSARYRTM